MQKLAEAIGEKIQGNPLNLKGHTLFIFSLADWCQRIKFENVPNDFESLKVWLPEQKKHIWS